MVGALGILGSGGVFGSVVDGEAGKGDGYALLEQKSSVGFLSQDVRGPEGIRWISPSPVCHLCASYETLDRAEETGTEGVFGSTSASDAHVTDEVVCF